MPWFRSSRRRNQQGPYILPPSPSPPPQLLPPASPPPRLAAPPSAPPGWTPAAEESHQYGLRNEADENDYDAAETFCARHPVHRPRLLPSNVVERIEAEGCQAWTLVVPRTRRFVGQVSDGSGEKGKAAVSRVTTSEKCREACLFSSLPIIGGLYATQGKSGVYYEVSVAKMDGIIAIGTACLPYPAWRFPGWNRLSAGLHLDDMRKFWEDGTGGRDYTPFLSRLSAGDTIGCGYDFSASSIFFTHNGVRLPDAFGGVYLPRTQHDVYAAIGVEGACEFEVNFGTELFRWKEGNEWAWRVEGHIGRLSGTSGFAAEELPAYSTVGRR